MPNFGGHPVYLIYICELLNFTSLISKHKSEDDKIQLAKAALALEIFLSEV